MATKVHELLAVQGSLAGQASKVRSDLATTFEKKSHLFKAHKKSFTSSEENAPTIVEEQLDIQSTVRDEIEWVSKPLAKAVDAGYQIDLANTAAKADIKTEDGDILAKDIPATTLLWLEKRIAEWKELIAAIPTLDPAKGFQPDPEHGHGHYKARDVVKQRKVKTKKLYVKYQATKEHPAQTELVDEDVPIGSILEQEWSGLITPAKKADLLDRVETLYRAVTKARSKANDHSIDTEANKLGKELLDFVFKPLQNV